MIRCAQDARIIVGNGDAATVGSGMVRTRAVVSCFTEIGEAASRLTPAAGARVGGLPSRQIVGMRNIVVHVCWGIDVVQVVKTVHDGRPELIRALDAALSSGDAAGDASGQ